MSMDGRVAAERRGGWGRRKGAGGHDGLVIAVALACEPLSCVERPDIGGLAAALPLHFTRRLNMCYMSV